MKSHYRNFADHCIRFYFRHTHPVFSGWDEQRNWKAVEAAVRGRDTTLLQKVYAGLDTLEDNVYWTARARGIPQDVIWEQIDGLRTAVLQERGILKQEENKNG